MISCFFIMGHCVDPSMCYREKASEVLIHGLPLRGHIPALEVPPSALTFAAALGNNIYFCFDQTMVMCDVEFDLNARQPSVTLFNQRPFVLPGVVTSLRLMTAYSRDNCFYIAARIGL